MLLLKNEFLLSDCNTAIKLEAPLDISFILDPLNYCDRAENESGFDPAIMMTAHTISLFANNNPDGLFESVDFSHIRSIEHIEGVPDCINMVNSENKVIMPCFGTVYTK
jgi:hypothetical protein